MAADLYALYLRSYTSTLAPEPGSGVYRPQPTTAGVSDGIEEIMAIAIGVEDATMFKTNAGKDGVEEADKHDPSPIDGFRPRWRVLEIIEEWNRSEPPPPDDEEDEDDETED
jgi:hypothetical protein